MKRALLVLVMAMVVMGCSTKFSTLEPGEQGSGQTAYHAGIDSLMKDLHLSMIRTFPGRNLTLIDAEGVKGYSTWTRFVLDTYTQQAFFIPVKGIDAEGNEVDAYAFEVSGEGSSGSGRSKNVTLWETTKKMLDGKYPTVVVK